MYDKSFFDRIKQLINKLETYRKTSTITFKDMDEKLTLKDVYQTIYPSVQVDMSCPTCVTHYLLMLESFYQREYPIFIKKTEPVDEPKTLKKVHKKYVGVRQNRKTK